MTTGPQSGAPESGMPPLSVDALLRAARGGDGRASCRLGDIYREGQGVGQDWDEAFRWYSLGASQGDAHAQNNLATMFLRGVGCREDGARAVFWYRKSAGQGHMTAQANLGKRHLHGEGTAPDPAEAFRWFLAASRQGDLASTWELGTMYRFGRGVKRNIVAAAGFHLNAARGGVVAGELSLGDYFDELQDIALAGDQVASRLLSDMHCLGLGVEVNPVLTWTWIRWAKERCKPVDDPAEIAEVEAALIFYEIWVSAAARRQGERVLEALLKPLPRTMRERPMPRVRFKRRRSTGSGGEKESA